MKIEFQGIKQVNRNLVPVYRQGKVLNTSGFYIYKQRLAGITSPSMQLFAEKLFASIKTIPTKHCLNCEFCIMFRNAAGILRKVVLLTADYRFQYNFVVK